MNHLHSLYDLHATNQKNREGMQPIIKMQGMSKNLRFNMDRRFIPNPKSSQSLKGGQKPH